MQLTKYLIIHKTKSQQLIIKNKQSIKLKCVAGRFDEKDAVLRGNELPNYR